MAIKPVGYRSPFQKKASPMKAFPVAMAAGGGFGAFLSSGGGQALMGALPGIISGIGSLFGGKRRRREQKRARQQMLAARKAYMNIEKKDVQYFLWIV